ncbi:IS982 family transposase [Saccharicrinis aurantiacus]|uniref:IS982 family transposase n=2 Tax=Saccharicrinis aurantiacus TaxID=1849719 RepID=UPI000839627E|nr:IS982 family transposase [Saccharicrinis aurantiacus]
MMSKVTEIFYLVDEFCKEFELAKEGHVLTKDTSKNTRKRKFKMSDSEVITILILFHLGQFRNLKHFYINYVQKHMVDDFPETVSYNRFTELQRKVLIPMSVFLQVSCLGECTGISFIDSTPIRACHIKREKQNKVFKDLAQKGKCSMGWFYGFKLHIVINDKGEILDFLFTHGNVDDRAPLKNKNFHDKIFGKLIADKGYISKNLFEDLFIDGIHMITKIKKNMKNALMHIHDKVLLKKRALIETVNDELKNICQIEHTRHRSFENFLSNLIAGLIVYHFLPKKPSLNIDIIDNDHINKAA